MTKTRSQTARRILVQEWRDITVPIEQLRPLIPPELELDTFEGQAYIGLIPFTITGARPVGFPKFPPITSFHDTNLRTYVRHRGGDPGVWLFSLDANSLFAVQLARRFFKLRYHLAKIEMSVTECGGGREIDYAMERVDAEGAGLHVRYHPIGEASFAEVGTLEHFLLERYTLYTSDGANLYSGRIRHTPYRIQSAEAELYSETLIETGGIARPATPPLCHYVRGVDVDVFPVQRVK
ncbi:MAG: DUF2071 domain-containing protein [Armatimonadetes bacterium]|nr:DUF2071 domain-containing protein [Armatimonadota bacterium]